MTISGVLNTLKAVKNGYTLEELKTSHPLLACEMLPDRYVLIDGNHRLVIQWDDVKFCLILT